MARRKRGGALRAAGTLALAAGVKAMRHGDDADAVADRDAPAVDAPANLPKPKLKDALKRTFAEIGNDHVLLVAAGVTFYALLALFPGLAAIVSIYGLFADPAALQDHLALLEGQLPGGAVSVIGDQLEVLVSQNTTGLGLAFVVGLATSLWSANAGAKAIFEALNIAYEETEDRGFIALTLRAFAFTIGAMAFLAVAVLSVTLVPRLAEVLGLGSVVDTLLTWLVWPILLIVVAALMAVLYRYGPSREPAEWRWLSWGSGIAALLWLTSTALFSWYAANFGSYDATYGSLGAVIGFMTWIWISTIVLILGAELNSELEHQTKADTTTGRDRPMGARGAVMADRAVGGPKRSGKRGDDL